MGDPDLPAGPPADALPMDFRKYRYVRCDYIGVAIGVAKSKYNHKSLNEGVLQ